MDFFTDNKGSSKGIRPFIVQKCPGRQNTTPISAFSLRGQCILQSVWMVTVSHAESFSRRFYITLAEEFRRLRCRGGVKEPTKILSNPVVLCRGSVTCPRDPALIGLTRRISSTPAMIGRMVIFR